MPAAYLNYILFDQQYNVLDMGWRPVTSASSWNKAKVSFDPINIKEAGFIFVYLSYENESSNWIYFDDFKVTHTKSNIVQYNEYYPFGLQTANSWTRENSANNFLYNAGSELNNATSNYEMFFREYDPALGRMNAVDPMASKYASLTPYNYAFNDPVFWNDPLGDDASDPSRGFNWYNYGRNSDGERVYHDASGGTSMYGSSWNYETYGGGFAKYGVGVSYGLTYEQHRQLKQNEEKAGEKVYTNNPEVIKVFMDLMKAGYFIINIGNDWVALGEGLQLRDQSVLATGGIGSSMAFTFEDERLKPGSFGRVLDVGETLRKNNTLDGGYSIIDTKHSCNGQCNHFVSELVGEISVAMIPLPIGKTGVVKLASKALRFTPDQQAIINLTKEAAKRRGGVTLDEAKILKDWSKEYNLLFRGPEIHLGRNFNVPHIHVGTVNHVKIIK